MKHIILTLSAPESEGTKKGLPGGQQEQMDEREPGTEEVGYQALVQLRAALVWSAGFPGGGCGCHSFE